MKKIQYVVLLGMQLLHNNARLKAGDPVELTDEEAEPLLGSVVALPEDAKAKLEQVVTERTAEVEGLLQRQQLQQQQIDELTQANTKLVEKNSALQADVQSKAKAIAELEEARQQAEAAAKAAAEAQVAAEAEVSKLQAELKAATAKATAKTESKPK